MTTTSHTNLMMTADSNSGDMDAMHFQALTAVSSFWMQFMHTLSCLLHIWVVNNGRSWSGFTPNYAVRLYLFDQMGSPRIPRRPCFTHCHKCNKKLQGVIICCQLVDTFPALEVNWRCWCYSFPSQTIIPILSLLLLTIPAFPTHRPWKFSGLLSAIICHTFLSSQLLWGPNLLQFWGSHIKHFN